MEGLLFFSWRHVSIRSADKTIFTPVILHLEKKIYRLVLPSPFTMQDVASHSVFQISFARYSLQSRAKQATEKRRAQETERSMFCFLSFWHINFSFSFLRSTTTFLAFVPCLRGKKNSLQTVQAQVEGNAHV